MPIPAADGDFFPIFFYRAFRPANAFPTYSERLASQDLQAAEIFEPGKSAGGARGRSDAVSSRRRRLSSDLIFIVRFAPAPSSLTYSERLASFFF